MLVQMQMRRGESAEWVAENPILADGEMGLETDTGWHKWGDGTTAWNSLDYSKLIRSDGTILFHIALTQAAYDALPAYSSTTKYEIMPDDWEA